MAKWARYKEEQIAILMDRLTRTPKARPAPLDPSARKSHALDPSSH